MRRLRRPLLRVRRQLRQLRPGRSMTSRPSVYAACPGHPLEHVPQSTLDIARAVLAGAVTWKDVDPDMAEPIADSVVSALAEAGLLRAPNAHDGAATSVRAVLDQIPDGMPVTARLAVEHGQPVTGSIIVPQGTTVEMIEMIEAIRVKVGSGVRVTTNVFPLGGHPRQRVR